MGSANNGIGSQTNCRSSIDDISIGETIKGAKVGNTTYESSQENQLREQK
jgi:hypothetical protein